jgi:hypothetical protein
LWSEGDWIVRREVWRGKPWFGTVVRVVRDSPEQLVTYTPTGAPFGFPEGDWPGGRHPWHGRAGWTGHGALEVQRPEETHAIWHFWAEPNRRFAGWYINFQRPFVTTPVGFDTQDLELDIWIPAGGNGAWQWKDAEVLDDRVREGRYTQAEIDQVRRDGERVAADLDAGRRWWDEGWSEFVPDPDWVVPELQAGWDLR